MCIVRTLQVRSHLLAGVIEHVTPLMVLDLDRISVQILRVNALR
jgi:hypothetical protein